MTEHTDDESFAERIKTLEDACLGIALTIDEGSGDADSQPGEQDPFQAIIHSVLGLRTEEFSNEAHVEELADTWDTLRGKLELPAGSLERFAQRGGGLGAQLRSPPDTDVEGDLTALAETDSGRTIWAVNAEGWDEEAFQGENVTLGMRPDGSIEPVEINESDSG
ncbi:hypothetical protein [Salinibaculum rarum]|uniref:hypothetical protein n=1 Tax=Salinibaculum rarum TaxID=3058903 RepID=UPI00266020A6|nr:hypothetical protein [Salinibaculum sp. KK48]